MQANGRHRRSIEAALKRRGGMTVERKAKMDAYQSNQLDWYRYCKKCNKKVLVKDCHATC